MKALINLRSATRLVAASVVLISLASLAPVTATASAGPSAVPQVRAARHDGLCDSHKWSLFGCRTDHARHRTDQLDAEGLSFTD